MAKAVVLAVSAAKSLRTVPPKDSAAILSKLESYARGERQDVVKLVGSPLRRLRHGAWRAVFEERKNEIVVLAVSHRRDAYR